jgi:hypothetical protein
MSAATAPPAPTPNAPAPPAAPLSVDAVVACATPEQRRELLQKLLSKTLAETAYLPQTFLDSRGELIGVFVPHYHSTQEPPEFTPEQLAEYERRFAAEDEHVSPEELLKLVMLADERLSKQR